MLTKNLESTPARKIERLILEASKKRERPVKTLGELVRQDISLCGITETESMMLKDYS